MKMIRVLVYEGEEEWINDCLIRRGVKETVVFGQASKGDRTITEAFIGFNGSMFSVLEAAILKGGAAESESKSKDE